MILDASVAVKWFVEEEDSADALALLDHDLHAPALIRLEVGNTFRTLVARGRLDRGEADRAFGRFVTAPVEVVDLDPSLVELAFVIALQLDHPIYDAAYLALATSLDAPLVTADRRLQAKVLSSTLPVGIDVQLLSEFAG